LGPAINKSVAELVLKSDLSHLDAVAEEFPANRDRMIQDLKACDKITCVVPNGNSFFFFNVSQLGRPDEEVVSLA